MGDDCIFCKIVKGEIPAEVFLANDDFIVILDANPKVEGHLLVIPKEHYDDFMDLPSGMYEKFLSTAKDAVEKIGAKDFNFVLNNGKLAGQVVGHLHLHVLPRKEGDGPVNGNHLTIA
jgi:histidine triad (HIT) family protein|tara:strand:- start:650 stop:1003 length:354 start_codon:yes stop_codon:yes gene_type:complete